MKTLIRSTMLAVLALAASCTTPELIDRTQPNYVKKSDLTSGQWYWKQTVVDVPRTSPAATIGYGSGLEKIRFEIHEDMLVGYRTYERIPGLDPTVDREKSKIGAVVHKDGRPYKGQPVVAYKIQSHFDRQRQYNPATGEQSPVLEENTSDRPWYEREFMRVDWSKPSLMNYGACLSGTGDWDGCGNGNFQVFRYVTAQDTNKQDNEWTEERANAKDPASELKYFDFTSEAIFDPPSYDIPGYGHLPMCMLSPPWGSPTIDCESALVRVRTSLKKVDEARVSDYEPLTYDDKMMTKFGFFRRETRAYDVGYGYTLSGRVQYAMRHNIWKAAHETTTDENGNPVVKTIPVTKRAIRPVVYYLTSNFPKELLPAANGATDSLQASWDAAFRRAVAVPRGLDPTKPASEGGVDPMFFVCESPVPEGAPAACGKPGTYARMGDLRYNLIPYVEQITGGLLGLGPSSMDPETGEIVQAVANIYGPGLDSWSSSSQQVMDVVNGELKLEDLVQGKDIHDYVFANLNATDPRRPATGPWTSQNPLVSESTRPMGSFANIHGDLMSKMQVFKSQGRLPLAKQDRKAVMAAVLEKNPALEAELFSLPEIRGAVMSWAPNAELRSRLQSDETLFRRAARDILLGQDPIALKRQELMNQSTAEIGCYYNYDYSDEDYVGVAKAKLKVFQAKFAEHKAAGMSDADARAASKKDVWDQLRREAWRSIAEHEVGHTVGLRHNFIGSFDSLNYQDGYWDLRKETIGVMVGGKRVLPVTPANLLDASKQNQKQIDAAMYEYEYSSIMDYGARVNSQNKGIGKYDNAAILFAYAGGFEPGYVEVFADTRHTAEDYAQPNGTMETDNAAKRFVIRGAHTELPVNQVEHYTPVNTYVSDKHHYTTMPFMFADKNQEFDKALDQGLTRMKTRSYRKWSEIQAIEDRIAQQIKTWTLSSQGFDRNDYQRSQDILAPVVAELKAPIPVEVPYMFCTDSEVGANVVCNRNDQGADIYEMTSKWMERFENTYVFSNFRRDRLMLNPTSVFQGKFGRYLGNIPNVYQQWLFNIWFLQDAYQLTTEQMDEFFGLGDPIWQNYWTMAVVDSANLLMQQLSTPSAGYHGRRADGTWVFLPQNKAGLGRLTASAEADLSTFVKSTQGGGYTDLVYVPRGPGRSMYTQYDTEGYDFWTRTNEVGHFWDQVAALQALTTSQTNFLGVDRGSDALKYSLPYYMTFNKELSTVFGSLWTEDRSSYAGSLGKLSDGTAVIRPPTFIHAQDYIAGFDYPLAQPTPIASNMVMESVEANPTWSTRFYSEIWAMMFFTDLFNQEYANLNQVYKLGAGEAVDPAPGFTVLTFPDQSNPALSAGLPSNLLGGYVYAALKKNSTTTPVANVTIMNRANKQALNYLNAKNSGQPVGGLTADQWEGQLRETLRTMEMMRGLFNIFSQVW
ncbi:MAG: zinc-dependent metalloprotease [Myxococcaceae bacterium]|nr:zinc-dependent metalloprotease [Myxococcaceae bacterium]